MNTQTREVNGHKIAILEGGGVLIADPQGALDMMMTVKYETGGVDALVIKKEEIAEDFFKLSTRLAGEVLQKFINYNTKLAIVGDFSGYTSKSLADFIRESNRGKDIFFVATEDEAIRMLEKAFVTHA